MIESWKFGIEKLHGPHNSVARNPLLAHIFYLAGRIEQYGSGMERIRNALAAQGQPPQTIEMMGYGFVLTMREPAGGGQIETSKRLGETTQKILDIIAANPSISRKELAERIGITADGVKYHLSGLQKKGRLKRIGPDKGGRWEVVG